MKIDKYANFNNLTDKNPFFKMFFGVAMLVIALFFNNIYFSIGIFLILLVINTFVLGIKGKVYFNLFKIPASFLIISILTIMVSIGTNSEGMMHSFNIGKLFFGISKSGINTALNLFFRALACISATYFIALSTPINQMVFVFKKLHFPVSFIEISVLIYRFINIFLEEFDTMMNAIELKNGRNNFKNSIKSMGILGGAIFFRVMDSYSDWKNVLDVKLYKGDFYF